MDCRNTLMVTEGDIDKALQILKEKGLLKAKKKAERTTSQGLVEAYVHAGGRIGAMIELNCETDFVARTDEFRELAHSLAMQVAAMSPKFITEEDFQECDDVEPKAVCLLLQPYIKDTTMTVQDVIVQAVAKLGENIRVGRFVRFELGDQETE
jgi:elongation factor Ts